jgi:hypothetical protein
MSLFSLLAPLSAAAHGYAGERFFPATLATDDPFAGDEFGLLTHYVKARNDEGELVSTAEQMVEWSKRITPNLALSLGADYAHLDPRHEPAQHGFDNFELAMTYMLWISAPHEAIVSVGLDADVGGTSTGGIGESYSTFAPSLLFGKGLGDLPDSMKYLRPIAVTGIVSREFPTRADEPKVVSWGMSLQYNLPYLNAFVHESGWSPPWRNMIPLIEASMESCTSGECAGKTTGTINPGVIWMSRNYGQIALEATIPVNERSGPHVGVLLQFHFYIDDIFPRTLGAPLFGSAPRRISFQ